LPASRRLAALRSGRARAKGTSHCCCWIERLATLVQWELGARRLGHGYATPTCGKSSTYRPLGHLLFRGLRPFMVYDLLQTIFSISTFSGSSSFGQLLQKRALDQW